MLGLEHDPDAVRLEVSMEPPCNLHGKPLLHLQVPSEQIYYSRELRQANDSICGQITNVRNAVEWQQVMLAE